jgi:hypothetical protein
MMYPMDDVVDPATLMARAESLAAAYRQADARGELSLPDPLPLPRTGPAPASRPVLHHATVGLGELLCLRGEALVRSAYERLLWRRASQEEVDRYVLAMAVRAIDVYQFIAALRRSPEGRRCEVLLQGQGWRRAILQLLRLPGGMRLWGMLRGLMALPSLRRETMSALLDLHARLDRIEYAMGGLGPEAARHPDAAQALRQRVQGLERRLQALARHATASSGRRPVV